MNLKPHFSRFLGAFPQRLHFAAHSHHPWPDVSFDAQQRAWLDAAELIDDKWTKVFGEVIPQAQAHLARLLHLPDPNTLCFAPSTHELVVRLLSCVERKPLRVLTTDSEFHSFARQLRRWEESGAAVAERIAVQPYASFAARFAAAAAHGNHDLVYFSQCFFNSGFLIEDLAPLVAAVRDAETLVVIDGYHGFMAAPTDLSALAERVFYVGGGYKYAMAGEGACYMHCPPSYAQRPVNTGWFAGFAALSQGTASIAYSDGGLRFMGGTFDPTGLYRFNAVMAWLQAQAVQPDAIHRHAQALQERLLEGLLARPIKALDPAALVAPREIARGNFLCFRHPQAGELHARLLAHEIHTDYREDRLRIGFGIYQDGVDVDELLRRSALALA
ncbi:MAG: aminotransferase class V-fold PLP-dependent enzyme [Nevskia sp.]|nr:aminotransferase class V-fold PLP-dependent enzyme [Nevskia sp.]